MTTKNTSGPVAVSTITETINAVTEAQRVAAETSAAAVAAASETFQTEEAILIAQMETLAGSLHELHGGLESVGIEEFSVPDMSVIDYLFTNAVRSTPKRRGRGPGRPRNAASTEAAPGVRGSKPCSLPNAILISMNQEDRGHEFSIADITAAVQAAPVNYPFSGSSNSTSVTVSQRLRELIGMKLVRKVSRGVYAITATGQKSATIALTELNAEVEAEVEAEIEAAE